MPEKEPQILKIEAGKKPIERLEGFIGEISAKFKQEGIPVDEGGRVDVDQFDEAYPRRIIEADKAWVKDLRERWNRAAVSGSQWSWILSREQILKQKTVGDAWEMLATAILHKNLGEDFIVVRTSEYDDARNGVDNLIIDKKSGSIVCAFDDVGLVSGLRFEEKKSKVLERNWRRGGADVAYGISFEGKQMARKLRKGRINHIPLFYFALSEDKIRKCLEVFSSTGVSREEEGIFNGFIDSFRGQIKTIKEEPLHPKLRERLDLFERSVLK
jgi:hypothetical protein